MDYVGLTPKSFGNVDALFTEILNRLTACEQYTSEYVAQAVDSWLDENFNVNVQYVVDENGDLTITVV